MASGYCDCACRDCFDVAIASNTNSPNTLCWACEEARCDADGASECQRDDAYGMDEVCEHGNWVCSQCGHGRTEGKVTP